MAFAQSIPSLVISFHKAPFPQYIPPFMERHFKLFPPS